MRKLNRTKKPLSERRLPPPRFVVLGENYTITADSTPVYDGWGWDDYWEAPDWMTWHAAMKKKYGLNEANRRFIKAYHEASQFAANYGWRTFNTEFINYAKLNGFYDGLFEGLLGLVGKTTSGATNVANKALDVTNAAVDNAASAASTTTKIMKYAIPVLIAGVLVGGGVIAYKYVKAHKPAA